MASSATDPAGDLTRDPTIDAIEHSAVAEAPAPPEAVRISRVASTPGGWIAVGVREASVEDPGGSEGRARMTLALYEGLDDGTVRGLAVPVASAERIHDPEPVLDEDAGATGGPAARVRGLAWLEGAEPGRLAVRYAPRNNDQPGLTWGAPVTVAAPGPGSQLALASALLEDGRTMLVWSRFDGQDDEIFWSVGEGSGWSEPRPVDVSGDDSVPDVTPTVAAVPGGAVATWSGYRDGTYQVFLARFDGETWSASRIAGPAGSVLPAFDRAADSGDGAAAPLLLFRTAEPRGWTVVEMDSLGVPQRQARADYPGAGLPERPRVVSADGAGVVLAWQAAADPGVAAGSAPTPSLAGESREPFAVPWQPLLPTETGADEETQR